MNRSPDTAPRSAAPARSNVLLAATRLVALARGSIVLGSLGMTTGCLITDPPQFKPPKHTRPALISDTALPDPRAVLVIDDAMAGIAPDKYEFSADVDSQEDASDPSEPSPFAQLHAYVYLDYGWRPPDENYPYPFWHSYEAKVIEPEEIPTPRRAKGDWYPMIGPSSWGCHRVTLMVFHVGDELNCPACSDDYSSITWQIFRCNSSEGTCTGLPLTGTGSCESWTNTCAQAQSKSACPDAGAGSTETQ